MSRSLEFTTKGKRRNKKNNRIPFRGQRVKCEVVWKQSIITEALLGESPWCHWLWYATRTSLSIKQSVLIHAQSSKQQLIIPSNNFPFDNAIEQAYLMLLSYQAVEATVLHTSYRHFIQLICGWKESTDGLYPDWKWIPLRRPIDPVFFYPINDAFPHCPHVGRLLLLMEGGSLTGYNWSFQCNSCSRPGSCYAQWHLRSKVCVRGEVKGRNQTVL